MNLLKMKLLLIVMTMQLGFYSNAGLADYNSKENRALNGTWIHNDNRAYHISDCIDEDDTSSNSLYDYYCEDGDEYYSGLGEISGVSFYPNEYLQALKDSKVHTPSDKYELGWRYFYGLGGREVKRDKGFNLIVESATAGYAEAQYKLASLYAEGVFRDVVSEDLNKAFGWYEKAAIQNHSKSQYEVGAMYQYGEGVYQSYAMAITWYKKAAKRNQADAQYELAKIYDKGLGGKIDQVKALKWYLEAAKHNDKRADSRAKELVSSLKKSFVSNYHKGKKFYKKGRLFLKNKEHLKSSENYSKAADAYYDAYDILNNLPENSIDNQKKLADDIYKKAKRSRKLAKSQKKRYAIIKEIQAEEDRDREIAQEDILNELKVNYINQIALRVKTNWRYYGAKDHWSCDVYILQDVDGNVQSVNLQSCDIDNNAKAKSFKDAIERAVYKSSPLPPAPDKRVFDQEILFHFVVNSNSNKYNPISSLPSCSTSKSAYKNNCFGGLAFSSGNKYVGEFKDNKRNGKGTFTFASGNKYVGEFKNGKYSGQGTYTYEDGEKYVGEYMSGKRHGQGTYTFASGNKYVGEFKNGKYSGQGTFTYADGEKYVGEHKNDKRHGQGTYTFAGGNKYVGEYKNNKRHGQGTYTYADGTIESGIWENGEFQYATNETAPIYSKTPEEEYAIGRKYLYGKGGINIDYKKAFEWIKRAAERGLASAQSDLGVLYIRGDGASKSDTQAVYWYRKAAEQGYDRGQYNLADEYDTGNSFISEDNGVAVYWYTKAAEQGLKEAQHNLGIMYLEGEGIEMSYKDAYKWFIKAANQKYDLSEHALGFLFESGYGVDKNIIEAGKWYLKASLQGNKKSSKALKRILSKNNTIDVNSTEGMTFSGSGSGFVVSKDGVIATNHHVIKGCNKIIVDELKADVISKDVKNDIALLQINDNYKYISSISYQSPDLGDDIQVFGYPLSDILSKDYISLTKGSVSSLVGIRGNLANFRFTAPVQPGNSGGPIVDGNGRVVGITRAVLDSEFAKGLKFLPQNINFGIQSSLLASMMKSKLIPITTDSISKSSLVDHYNRATKYIECYK